MKEDLMNEELMAFIFIGIMTYIGYLIGYSVGKGFFKSQPPSIYDKETE